MSKLAAVKNQLGRAIESGAFDTAQPLVIEYAAALRNDLSSAANASEREHILKDALQTLNTHLYLARALRSHISVFLQATTGHSVYQANRRQTYTWRVDG